MFLSVVVEESFVFSVGLIHCKFIWGNGFNQYLPRSGPTQIKNNGMLGKVLICFISSILVFYFLIEHLKFVWYYQSGSGHNRNKVSQMWTLFYHHWPWVSSSAWWRWRRQLSWSSLHLKETISEAKPETVGISGSRACFNSCLAFKNWSNCHVKREVGL